MIAHDQLTSQPERRAWFRSAPFDLTLTLGVFVASLAFGAIGLISQELFYLVLWLDVWLIAHPHLAAMYTRLVLDRESARRARPLLTTLPVGVVICTGAVGYWGGALWLMTGYYVWQTWHYTRQSYGVARALSRGQASDQPHGVDVPRVVFNDQLTSGVIYAFPLWGLLHRAHQDPDLFYGWPIYFPPVSAWVVEFMGAITLALFIIWCGQRVAYFLRRRRAAALQFTPQNICDALVLSHVLITAVSYLWVEEITQGWLFINIWHNLQYLVFVWAYNARRAERSPMREALDDDHSDDDLGDDNHSDDNHSDDAQADPLKLIRSLSQPTLKSGARYLGLCLIAGTLFFIGADALVAIGEPWMPAQGASLLLIVHLSINFHHYLVDAVIWTRKYNAPQQRHPSQDPIST